MLRDVINPDTWGPFMFYLMVIGPGVAALATWIYDRYSVKR
jgi:hypothetical protein